MADTAVSRYADLTPPDGTTSKGHPSKIHIFTQQGVTVKVPHLNNRGKHGRPVHKGFGPLEEAVDGEKPGRLVINLALEDPDEKGKFVLHFDPPFEFSIRIQPEDITRAGVKEKVRLVYWDRASKRWQSFPNERVRLIGDELEVWVSEWSEDPPVGMAP